MTSATRAGRVDRPIPLHTLEGVRGADATVVPFTTQDGLGLSLTRFLRKPCDDVVVVIHGLTTSTDMFVMPEHVNLVSYLLDHGYTDVWTLDFRMSNRHPYNLQRHRFTHDDIALYDHPQALATVRRHVGDRCIHVICHCLGSVSFMMSVFGGASRGVSSVISNSVSLTPRVPAWSRFKLAVFPFLAEYVFQFPYLDPNWAATPGLTWGKAFSRVVTLLHGECRVPQCHMLSVMWGSGWPALYSHENLEDVTHRRGGDLYGGTSVHYYRHVRKMLRAGGTAVKYDPSDPRHASLPDDYLARAADVRTPVLLMTGRDNRVFADSNVECHRRLEAVAPGRHDLLVLDGYGHQDVFMGKRNHVDVFPRLVSWLDGKRGRRPDDLPAAGVPAAGRRPATLAFREVMAGPFALGTQDPGAPAAGTAASPGWLTMRARVVIDDLDAFLSDPRHEGRLEGEVDFPPLGTGLRATGGVFRLFQPADSATKRMVYELALAVDGRPRYLAGEKIVRDEPGPDLWSDTTTLYVRLHDGRDASGAVLGAGTLRLGVGDLFALLKTLDVTGVPDAQKRTEKGRFLRFFLGELYDTYGPMLF